ncbi:MAG: hypothetical protein ACRCSN_19685 [Dermatophilaceae bacterium]
MPGDEPTNAEIARRLDDVVRRLDNLATVMMEEQRHASERYVLKAVYDEASKRWQAEVINVKEDLAIMTQARRQLQAIAVTAGLSGVTSLALWLIQTTRGGA